MAVTLFSGSNNALLSNVEEFFNINQTGVYTFHFDMDLMQDGDVLEWGVYMIVLTGGTAVKVDGGTFYGQDGGVPGLKAFHSDAYSTDLTDAQALRFSLKQTLVSNNENPGREVPRKVLRHA